ncbi:MULTISPECIES: hypothetical protein [unclassified Microcoleus]|uniref:hypothetical protein n=1 Tax=unclassified Microcoleus TaxID=2642155 RepID=UPI002FD387F6
MTIHEANELLANDKAERLQLLHCYANLCKEYGYIQGMIIANQRDVMSSGETLAEMQLLINQLTERLK